MQEPYCALFKIAKYQFDSDYPSYICHVGIYPLPEADAVTQELHRALYIGNQGFPRLEKNNNLIVLFTNNPDHVTAMLNTLNDLGLVDDVQMMVGHARLMSRLNTDMDWEVDLNNPRRWPDVTDPQLHECNYRGTCLNDRVQDRMESAQVRWFGGGSPLGGHGVN